MFDDAFAGLQCAVRNVRTLGPEHANAHFDHGLNSFIREGGCTPAIWARSRGASTRLLGITFMREPLSIYVRTDDSLHGVADLAGRRVALPAWPRLVFDFWRVAAHKGFQSALAAHGMDESDLEFIDVEEDKDPHRRLNLSREQTAMQDDISEYGSQLEALLRGDVDALFAKGAESAIVVRQSGGRIRQLYDCCESANTDHHINNSSPRLLTCSQALLDRHPESVGTYLATITHAAQWAAENPGELEDFVARECGIKVGDIVNFFPADYASAFLPTLGRNFIGYANSMKRFMLDNAYIDADFSLDEWIWEDATR